MGQANEKMTSIGNRCARSLGTGIDLRDSRVGTFALPGVGAGFYCCGLVVSVAAR